MHACAQRSALKLRPGAATIKNNYPRLGLPPDAAAAGHNVKRRLDGVSPRRGSPSNTASLGFGEPATLEVIGRDGAEVGLDVENRCTVEHVYASH